MANPTVRMSPSSARGYTNLSEWWRRRRLDVTSLRGTARVLAIVSLLCGLLAGLAAATVGLSSVQDTLTSQERNLLLMSSSAAVTAATAALGAATSRGRTNAALLARVLLGSLGALLAILMLDVADFVAALQEAGVFLSLLLLLQGYLAVFAAFVLLFTGRRDLRHSGVAAALGGLPFALFLTSHVTVLAAGGSVGELTTTTYETAVVAHVMVLGITGGLLLLVWQLIEGLRAGRDTAAAVSGWVVTRVPRLGALIFLSVLATKAIWLLAGYAGWLPGAFRNDEWVRSRQDRFAWILALLFIAAAAAVLRRQRNSPHPVGIQVATWLIAGALVISFVIHRASYLLVVVAATIVASPTVAATAAVAVVSAPLISAMLRRDGRTLLRMVSIVFSFGLLLACAITLVQPIRNAIFGVVPERDPQRSSVVDRFVDLQAFIGNNLNWITVVAIVLMLLLGAALTLSSTRASLHATGMFLLVFGLWALPRVIDVLFSLLMAEPPRALSALRVEPLTLDAIVTLFILMAAANLLLRRRSPEWPRTLAVLMTVLLVSTVVTHGDAVVPQSMYPLIFYAGFVAVLAYRFLFDAQELNEPGDGREAHVLWAVAVAGGVLGVAGIGVAGGTVRPGTAESTRAFISLLTVPPAAFIAISTAIGRFEGDKTVVRQ